eukprot:scaffold3034_cov173-Amphora_coffeaeformis.AAC.14
MELVKAKSSSSTVSGSMPTSSWRAFSSTTASGKARRLSKCRPDWPVGSRRSTLCKRVLSSRDSAGEALWISDKERVLIVVGGREAANPAGKMKNNRGLWT